MPLSLLATTSARRSLPPSRESRLAMGAAPWADEIVQRTAMVRIAQQAVDALGVLFERHQPQRCLQTAVAERLLPLDDDKAFTLELSMKLSMTITRSR